MNVILGIKKDMTQVFRKDGRVLPATLVDVSDVRLIGKREKAKDGYSALVLAIGKKKRALKSESTKFSKLGYVPRFVREFRIEDESVSKIGEKVEADVFKVGDKVKVTGTTKGRGFAGVIKRYNFKGGPRTHGQSNKERSPGSIGGGTRPGRVFKGKRMPGHMGVNTRTVANLEIVRIDKENSIIAIKGALPGSRNSLVKIVSIK